MASAPLRGRLWPQGGHVLSSGAPFCCPLDGRNEVVRWNWIDRTVERREGCYRRVLGPAGSRGTGRASLKGRSGRQPTATPRGRLQTDPETRTQSPGSVSSALRPGGTRDRLVPSLAPSPRP